MAVEQSAKLRTTSQSPSQVSNLTRWWRRHRLQVIPYFYIAPFFILFSIFLVYPIVQSFYLSFHKQQGLSTPTFVGLRNYFNLWDDHRFRDAADVIFEDDQVEVAILTHARIAVAALRQDGTLGDERRDTRRGEARKQ